MTKKPNYDLHVWSGFGPPIHDQRWPRNKSVLNFHVKRLNAYLRRYSALIICLTGLIVAMTALISSISALFPW